MKTIIINEIEYELIPIDKKTKPFILEKKFNLEIHPKEFGEMTWNEAIELVKTLGDGWRLPIIEELYIINKSNLNYLFNNINIPAINHKIP